MKLQKQLSRKSKDKEYAKWVLVIPPEKVKEAGWKEGQELEVKIKGNNVTIEKKSS